MSARIARRVKWWWQRRTRGWDDRNVWSIDLSVSAWLAPRIEALRDACHGYPFRDDIDEETWFAVLDKMAQTFALVGRAEILPYSDRDRLDYVDEGLDLFREFFFDLWD